MFKHLKYMYTYYLYSNCLNFCHYKNKLTLLSEQTIFDIQAVRDKDKEIEALTQKLDDAAAALQENTELLEDVHNQVINSKFVAPALYSRR